MEAVQLIHDQFLIKVRAFGLCISAASLTAQFKTYKSSKECAYRQEPDICAFGQWMSHE